MLMLNRTAAALLLIGLLLTTNDALAKRRAASQRSPWSTPQCAQVGGFPAVAVSLDGGHSVLPHEETLEGVQIYTFGLAALPKPNHLIAASGRALLVSSDSGCTWSVDGRFVFPQALYAFIPDAAGVWAWSRTTSEIFRFDANGELASQRTLPVLFPIAFAVDGDRLATADDEGRIWWSGDAGATWELHATVPASMRLNALELSPRGRMHAIAAALANGAQVTFDGGATWQMSQGLDHLNVFRFAFSPLDPDVVWAVTIDPRIKGVERRAIHRSDDGGRSFRRAIAASAQLPMTNGFTLAPSPVDASLLYFVLPETSMNLVDDAGRLHWSAKLPHRDINSIVFSPASPHILYFGLKVSDMTATP